MPNPKSKFISTCLCYNNHSKNHRETKMIDSRFNDLKGYQPKA